MLKTFSRVAGPIKEALTVLNRLEMWRSEFEPAIDEIFNVLNVTKMTMDQISKDDADLLTAEGALEFLFDELDRLQTPLSQALLEQLEIEINHRRQKSIVSLLKFLQNPQSLNEDKTSFFSMSSKKEIIELASSIWKDRFKGQTIEGIPESVSSQEASVGLSAGDRLAAAVGKRKTLSTPPSMAPKDEDKRIKLACNNYLATNVMHPSLKQIFDALLLVKPTSIKNEQNFSMSSNFLSKTRKRMGIRTINDLCVLKSHFIAKSKQ